MSLFTLTGLLLIIVPLCFNAAFFMLGRRFEYPDILRQPVATILQKFRTGGPSLVALWYGFAVTALLFVPLALLLHGVFGESQPLLSQSAAILGVLAGLVQAMGLLRWTFLVPVLAQNYAEASTPAGQEAIATTFQAFHQYIGVAIGEHLGYIFTSGWTVLVSVLMLQAPLLFSPLVAVLGIIGAAGIFVGVFEQSGFKAAAMINAISYVVWSLWLIAAGVTLLTV